MMDSVSAGVIRADNSTDVTSGSVLSGPLKYTLFRYTIPTGALEEIATLYKGDIIWAPFTIGAWYSRPWVLFTYDIEVDSRTSYQKLGLYNIDTREVITHEQLPNSDYGMRGLALSRDGRFVLYSYYPGNKINMIEITTRNKVHEFDRGDPNLHWAYLTENESKLCEKFSTGYSDNVSIHISVLDIQTQSYQTNCIQLQDTITDHNDIYKPFLTANHGTFVTFMVRDTVYYCSTEAVANCQFTPVVLPGLRYVVDFDLATGNCVGLAGNNIVAGNSNQPAGIDTVLRENR